MTEQPQSYRTITEPALCCYMNSAVLVLLLLRLCSTRNSTS